MTSIVTVQRRQKIQHTAEPHGWHRRRPPQPDGPSAGSVILGRLPRKLPSACSGPAAQGQRSLASTLRKRREQTTDVVCTRAAGGLGRRQKACAARTREAPRQFAGCEAVASLQTAFGNACVLAIGWGLGDPGPSQPSALPRTELDGGARSMIIIKPAPSASFRLANAIRAHDRHEACGRRVLRGYSRHGGKDRSCRPSARYKHAPTTRLTVENHFSPTYCRVAGEKAVLHVGDVGLELSDGVAKGTNRNCLPALDIDGRPVADFKCVLKASKVGQILRRKICLPITPSVGCVCASRAVATHVPAGYQHSCKPRLLRRWTNETPWVGTGRGSVEIGMGNAPTQVCLKGTW